MSNRIFADQQKRYERTGMGQVDFVYVIGDAYVDHPSFGHAIISRLLEAHGYTVGIIAQPDFKNKKSSVFWESRGLVSWFPPEIWIRWSTTIPSRKDGGQQMRIHRAV